MNAFRVFRSILMAMGTLWIPLESFEGISNADVGLPYWAFILVSLILGSGYFILDGLRLNGFLRREITLTSNSFDTTITVKFGDIFSKRGWKAISVNNFFDSVVDDVLIAHSSLHGKAIDEFWSGDGGAWQREIDAEIMGTPFEEVQRSRGNTRRFPVGTTAGIISKNQKFLFVAFGQTNISDNTTDATTDSLARAMRGMLEKARSKCAGQPLNIPLMGSGLSRVGIRSAFLVDIILAVVFEQTKQSKITDRIVLVLPKNKQHDINLGAIERDWK